jgi:hypothetical protein
MSGATGENRANVRESRMELDDPRWDRLHGGYRIPYDPRKALGALERGEETKAAWKELWNELHHQGDVDEASYAAVPHLVRIHAARGIPDANTYAMVAVIELARRADRNPVLPSYLQKAYDAAWRHLVELGIRELGAAKDRDLVSSIIGVIAIAKEQPALGTLSTYFSEDERKEFLKDSGPA